MDLEKINFHEKDLPRSYMSNEKLPAVGSEYAWTPERIKEIDSCRKNLLYFAENYFFITTLDEGKKKIKLYKAQKRVLKSLEKNRFVVLLASRQVGKALALDTPVPTPSGWKTMGTLKTGDYVFDNYGNPSKIIKAWDVMKDRPCYEITFDNGEKIVADKDHLWMTETFYERRRGKGQRKKRTTEEILNTLFHQEKQQKLPNHGIKRANKPNTTIIDNGYHYIISVKEVPSVPVRCITVDSEDAMFLCGKTCIPTSNTTLMTIFALWMACFIGDYRVILVANKEATAKNILRRVKMAYEHLPNWLKPPIKQWDVKEIIFGNDSSIAITTTTSTAARGDTANAIVIDEMSFIPYNFMEEFWKSTIPVVSSSKKSKIFAISTPNGTGNKFYEVYSSAERKEDPDWKAERIDWWEVPGRDEKWKKSAVASLGSEESFDQEFGNKFIAVGESAINSEIITRFREESKEPKIILEEGNYKIWDTPKKKHLYIIGADVGEGLGATASTIQVLDMTDLTKIKQVACYRNQFINPYHFTKVLYEVAGQWGSPYIFMERNNVGGGILDTLYNTFHYEKIATQSSASNEFSYDRHGIYSHTNTKLECVTNMRYWINDLQALEINDITTIQEFETFVKYPNGTWKKKVGEKLFDDMVMALCWGLYALKTEICERYFEILEYDDNGKPKKITKSSYDEEAFFGSQALSKNFNDSDPLPVFLNNPSDTNEEMDLMTSNGWSLF